MPRYVALLRGVSPMNCRMPALKSAFEAAGFANVCTLLSSGNAVFDARAAGIAALQRKCEAAMGEHLDRTFATIVRQQKSLQALVDADPFEGFGLTAQHKRVVTFLREPTGLKPTLPIELDGASILAIDGQEIFSAYLPGPKGPVFMALIEKTFGQDVTTRTWDTVRKCAAA